MSTLAEPWEEGHGWQHRSAGDTHPCIPVWLPAAPWSCSVGRKSISATHSCDSLGRVLQHLPALGQTAPEAPSVFTLPANK